MKEIKVLFSTEKNSYNKIIAAQLQSGKCNDLSLWPGLGKLWLLVSSCLFGLSLEMGFQTYMVYGVD